MRMPRRFTRRLIIGLSRRPVVFDVDIAMSGMMMMLPYADGRTDVVDIMRQRRCGWRHQQNAGDDKG